MAIVFRLTDLNVRPDPIPSFQSFDFGSLHSRDPFSHPSGSSAEAADRSVAFATKSKLLVSRPMSIHRHPENVQCQAVSIQCLWNCSSGDLRPQANLLLAHDMVESPQNPNPQPVVRSPSGKESLEPKGPLFAQPPSCFGLFYSWPLLFFFFFAIPVLAGPMLRWARAVGPIRAQAFSP